MNGRVPPNTLIGLFRYTQGMTSIDPVTLATRSIAASPLTREGHFSFHHLGELQYVLAIMLATAPPSPTNITVQNNPGIITLTAQTPEKDLQPITFHFNQED